MSSYHGRYALYRALVGGLLGVLGVLIVWLLFC